MNPCREKVLVDTNQKAEACFRVLPFTSGNRGSRFVYAFFLLPEEALSFHFSLRLAIQARVRYSASMT